MEYFFGLSGFIIYYVHAGDIGQPKQLVEFFKKRLIRIIPMYWIVISLMLLAFLFHPVWGAEKSLDARKVLLDYFLIPREGPLLLPPAWTLEREFLFYLVFCISIVAPKFGASIFFFWEGAVVLLNAVFFLSNSHPDGLIWFLFGIHNLGFVVGVGCAWAIVNHSGLSKRRPLMLIAGGAAGVIGTMFVEWHAGAQVGTLQTASQEIGRSLLYTLSFGLVIYGCATTEERFGWMPGKYLSLLGASSYVIYLIHEPLSSVTMKIMSLDIARNYINPNVAYIAAILAVIGASALLHLSIERPVTRYLRTRFMRGQSRGA